MTTLNASADSKMPPFSHETTRKQKQFQMLAANLLAKTVSRYSDRGPALIDRTRTSTTVPLRRSSRRTELNLARAVELELAPRNACRNSTLACSLNSNAKPYQGWSTHYFPKGLNHTLASNAERCIHGCICNVSSIC